MRTTFILTTAAIALVAGIASASEIDPFTTLEGVETRAMTPSEMQGVKGAGESTAQIFFYNISYAVFRSDQKAYNGVQVKGKFVVGLIFDNPSP